MIDHSQQVLAEIKLKHIAPIPRWIFVVKGISLWLLFSVTLVTGGIASAIMVYIFKNNDWDVYDRANGLVQFLLLTMPYLWIIGLIVIIIIARYEFGHTHSGYRYATYMIIGVSVVASVMLGFGFDRIGLAQAMDELFVNNIPLYPMLSSHNGREQIWSQPDRGLLSGMVVGKIDDQELELVDFSGKPWKVLLDDMVIMRIIIPLDLDDRIKIIGVNQGEAVFKAKEIRPWSKGCAPKKGCR